MKRSGQQLVPPRPELPFLVLDLQCDVREYLVKARAEGAFEPRPDGWIAGWDPEFTRALAERGWAGMVVPAEYGGPGLGPLERYVVSEEMLAAGAPVAAHWTADRQTAPGLLRFGTGELKRRYLPRIARGELFVAVGMSEPEAGSDLAAVRTRAEPVAGGWLLNGRKVWTSHAHRADIIVTLARSTPVDPSHRHAGLSQFIVETGVPGLEVRPLVGLDGEHHFNEVLFEDVFVPAGHLLGAEGEGWTQVTSELAFERSGPDRFLSTYPIVTALLESGIRDNGEIGRLVTRMWTLRQLSLSVAGALAQGRNADVAAALVKDLGTRFEGEVVEVARRLTAPDPERGDGPATGPLTAMLDQAVGNAPGYTLRGGANEILRGVVARSIGLT